MRTKTKLDWLLFPIYQGQYRKQVKKTMKRVKFSIYLNQSLQADYDKEFGGPSEVLYTSSSLEYIDHSFSFQTPIFSYIGNLMFDRPKALMDVADVLQSINKEYKLDIYGKTLDAEIESALRNHPGISFKGFINYEEVEKGSVEDGVIISLTSFPARLDTLWQCVESLKRQTVRPEKIILYLSKEQVKEDVLPPPL